MPHITDYTTYSKLFCNNTISDESDVISSSLNPIAIPTSAAYIDNLSLPPSAHTATIYPLNINIMYIVYMYYAFYKPLINAYLISGSALPRTLRYDVNITIYFYLFILYNPLFSLTAPVILMNLSDSIILV